MDNILTLLFSVALATIVVMVISAVVFDPIPGTKKWESEYEAKWFTTHGFCETCGQPMDWQQKNKNVRFNAATGNPVYEAEWCCTAEPKHSHYGLVPWCVKEYNA